MLFYLESLVCLEIYRLIENNRQSFDETQNEILRRLLGLGPSEKSINRSGGINLGYGVFLANGSKLRKIYKGTEYLAEVKDSYIWVKGEKHTSASSAAIAITGNSVNGWVFWEFKGPQESEYIPLNNLRKKEDIATRHSLKGVPALSEKDLAEFD